MKGADGDFFRRVTGGNLTDTSSHYDWVFHLNGRSGGVLFKAMELWGGISRNLTSWTRMELPGVFAFQAGVQDFEGDWKIHQS